MPTLAELEQWMEEQLPQNLQEFHSRVHTTILEYSAQIYDQILDYTPTLAQIESSIPVLGPAVAQAATSSKQYICHEPPKPQPVPTYRSITNSIMARADAITGSRRRTSIVAGVAIVGLTCAVLTREVWLPARYTQRPRRVPRSKSGLRCDAIVILGADTPVGQALAHHLAAQGFIVLASVADEESKVSFDSLIPPSSRGYIKSIVLRISTDARAEDVTYFVRAVAAAKELRWPLTAAGDPYARPGFEVDVVSIVNALSFRSVREGKSTHSSPSASSSFASSMHPLDVEIMAKEMNQRAIVPLATIKALLPILTRSQRFQLEDTSTDNKAQPHVIISIVNSGDEPDAAARALLAGMERLQKDVMATTQGGGPSIVATTLKVETSTLATLARSIFPSSIGGVAPTPSRPILTRNGSSIIEGSQYGKRPLDASGRIVEKVPKMSSSRSSLSSSVTEARMQRSAEIRSVLQAASVLLLETSVSSSRLRPIYIARLPSTASKREARPADNDTLETTVLSRAVNIIALPFAFAARTLTSHRFDLQSLWSRGPGAYYRGTSNTANSRPAFGPGPGPASNTHSRSCIRAGQTQPKKSNAAAPRQDEGRPGRTSGTGPSSAEATKQRLARPASTASVGSDAARSSASDDSRSARNASGPASSAPPSNPDLSSSGILSSVPSSAFGDASEEEHLVDSDFGSTDSPHMGSHDDAHRTRAGGRQSVGHASISSDGDDTALGARNYDAADASSSSVLAGETPSASMHPEQHGMQQQHEYGFPSPDGTQGIGGEEAPWMGPPSRGGTDSPIAAGRDGATTAEPGLDTPLGHSWVALGQSTLEHHSEQNRRPSDRRR